jgi:GT2 family glycosyltransferase
MATSLSPQAAESCDAMAVLPAERLLYLSGRCLTPWAAGAAGALHTALGRVSGDVHAVFQPEAGATRFSCLMRLPPMPSLTLRALEVGGRQIPLSPERRNLRPAEALAELRRLLAEAPDAAAAPLRALLPRLPFDGTDSLAGLAAAGVHLEIERAGRTGARGLLLQGWILDPGAAIRAIRACTEAEAVTLDPAAFLRVPRADVRAAAGSAYALDHDEWGICAFADLPREPCWIEVELRGGEVGQRALAPTEAAGLPGIRQLLGLPQPPGSRLRAVMEGTIGPAVEAMNLARLRHPRPADELLFGTPPLAPEVSVVVPLHGRVDFMEMQLALFSARPDPRAELIYVLDDPRRREEAERLALAAEARFGLSFRLMLLDRNWGFAPACNEGARRARGRHLCLLNSDVFPLGTEGMGFLAPLRARLDADPALGAVGPLLLYEDGTVQHRGMHFEPVRGLPPWPFPIHGGKAQPPPAGTTPLPARAITGACLVLRRADWDALGGFDEGFVVGDFEDADLCLRLRERGLASAVDPTVRLFHLERQSQEAAAGWRFNATLFNAWRHARRWGLSP